MATEAAFILGASDAILQSLDHQTLPCCMPRKGSLGLDLNGLIGPVQKVNKHYICLLGLKLQGEILPSRIKVSILPSVPVHCQGE